MYQRIYKAYQALSKGDKAELKRCNLEKLADAPAYFRVLKFSGVKDNQQTRRVLFLLVGIKVSLDEKEGVNVATALFNAGVKEAQIIQITRSGNNSVDYLKRQLVRCNNVSLDSLGKLGQFWGEHVKRNLLKDFILSENDTKTNNEE